MDPLFDFGLAVVVGFVVDSVAITLDAFAGEGLVITADSVFGLLLELAVDLTLVAAFVGVGFGRVVGCVDLVVSVEFTVGLSADADVDANVGPAAGVVDFTPLDEIVGVVVLDEAVVGIIFEVVLSFAVPDCVVEIFAVEELLDGLADNFVLGEICEDVVVGAFEAVVVATIIGSCTFSPEAILQIRYNLT